ncbi:MAG: hypothetical protein JW973_10765 [Bacteroidales bacterium]|nr:hypothetical protein [Bacteroidales bacterium]
MKTRNLFLGMSFAVAALFFTSCEMDRLRPEGEFGILPERFKVDIPNSLSNSNFKSTFKSTANDTISGNAIYGHLNTFIAVGEVAADIVVATIWAIHFYNIEDVLYLSFTSDDDNRVKNLEVVKNVEFRDREWEYQLTITDAESEGNEDGGIGMQVFWSKNPIEGIALYKPYNLDRNKNKNAEKAMASIEYSEKGTGDYETYMIVEVAGLPLPDGIFEPFGMETLKMFVGKKGENIDVYGNSNHPNMQFNPNDNEAVGFGWAFVASGNDSKDIAVAEVGLPRSSADITDREEILVDNSIKNVITRELTNYVVSQYAKFGLTLNPEEVAALLTPYLKNADAPGYFNNHGFIQGGVAPNSEYSELESNIESLVPYNPYTITNLGIEFK